MWKAIKNISSAVKDITLIAIEEIVHQAGRASDTTNNATAKLAAKAHNMRENYEVNLTSRKEGVDGELIIVRKHEHEEA